MFVNALNVVGGFTRPIFTIARRYESDEVDAGSGTMFFVNAQGWAVTTRTLAQIILESAKLEKQYAAFKTDKNTIMEKENFEDELKVLEIKYGMNRNNLAQMKVSFFDCVDSISGVECKIHRSMDLAAIKMEGFQDIKYVGHAVFAADGKAARPGKFLCRLGYPFPEFRNYIYDEVKDDILWTTESGNSPRFPVEGMVTRLVAERAEDGIKKIMGIEMSTPGMHGINGGPLFDKNGIVYGMQTGITKLNLGQCLHVGVITEFLERQGIEYFTAPKEIYA